MGNTWTLDVYGKWFGEDRYSFVQVWQGESFIGALLAMWRHRHEGSGCLQLNWRPRRADPTGGSGG